MPNISLQNAHQSFKIIPCFVCKISLNIVENYTHKITLFPFLFLIFNNISINTISLCDIMGVTLMYWPTEENKQTNRIPIEQIPNKTHA